LLEDKFELIKWAFNKSTLQISQSPPSQREFILSNDKETQIGHHMEL